MEFSWFATCTFFAFIPWISAEEKLLYQTPTENRWRGWEATTNGLSSLNVIKLVFCCFTQYPDYKHPICQRAAFLWWSCRVHDGYPPSLSEDTPVSRAPLLKYNVLLRWWFLPVCRVILHSFVFWTSNLHMLSTILLLFISKRLTFRTLVLKYIFYFIRWLTSLSLSLFIFSGITFQCPIILHCVVRFAKNRKIGYGVH